MTMVEEAREGWRTLDLAAKARLRWRLKARPKQITPDTHTLCADPGECETIVAESWQHYPLRYQELEREEYQLENGHVPWFIWLILAGRGWGKTRTGAEDIAAYMLAHRDVRVALVAPTFSDGRDTMVEGESGLLGVIPDALIESWNRSIGELILKNGSRAKIFSAEEPKRLRGPQHHRAWCDEIAAWRYLQATWDMLMFGLRLGRNPQVIITTTPKPYRFIKKLIAESADPAKKTLITSGATFENERNLPRTVLDKLRETYEGTRLGRQELNAEVLEELGGGIIQQADIDAMRLEAWQVGDALGRTGFEHISELMGRVVTGVDPAVTATSNSDETGIVVAGLTAGPCPFCPVTLNPRRRPHAVVLEDATLGRVSDNVWASRVVEVHRAYHGDRVVAEVNNGGDLVESVMRAVDPNLPVTQVRASRGKVKRAEPIGALYERHEVHHVGTMAQLEDQLTRLGIEDEEEPDPDAEESTSPDRADACVWALTKLMIPDGSPLVGSVQAKDQRLRNR